MSMKQTDAQVKARIIQRINNLKTEAISRGFDYPTDPIENESVENLSAFLYEISEYILDHDLTEEARKQGLPYEFKNGIPTAL